MNEKLNALNAKDMVERLADDISNARELLYEMIELKLFTTKEYDKLRHEIATLTHAFYLITGGISYYYYIEHK